MTYLVVVNGSLVRCLLLAAPHTVSGGMGLTAACGRMFLCFVGVFIFSFESLFIDWEDALLHAAKSVNM